MRPPPPAPGRRHARLASAALAGALLAPVWLAGCAHHAMPAPSRQVLSDAEGHWEGRLSLKLLAHGGQAAQGASMVFSLQGSPRQGELDLSTPLGTQMAAVRWSEQQAALHTPEGQQTFGTIDELTRHVLGEAVPVRSLMSWLRGQADPGLPSQPLPGEATRFRQLGWDVDLGGLAQGQIEASRPATPAVRGATLKVRLDR